MSVVTGLLALAGCIAVVWGVDRLLDREPVPFMVRVLVGTALSTAVLSGAVSAAATLAR